MAGEVKLKLAIEGGRVVSAELDGVGSSLDGIGRGAGNAEGKVRSLIGTLEGYAKAAAGVFAVDRIYEYAKEVALLSARYETLGVSMDVVGRNAGYTREQLDATVAGLQRQGISMIESRQQVMRLVQAHIDLAEAERLARIAQDAAVIGNMNSSEAFANLIHGISTGQTDVLRTIGLNVSMEQSYKNIATQLHKNVDALTQNEKTQGVLNSVMAAGKDIAGTYEAAMDTAGKQINSMKRYTEDLKTTQGEVFNEVLTVAVMGYTSHLKESNEEMRAMAANGELKAWGMELAGVFVGIANQVDNLMNGVKMLGTYLAHTSAAAEIADRYDKKWADTAMGGDYSSGTKAKIMAEKAAAIKAEQEAYEAAQEAYGASADRFQRAWDERQRSLADKANKALVDSVSMQAKNLEVMAQYQAQFAAGLINGAQYAKQMNDLMQAAYGDNHKYADTPSTAAPKISEYQRLMESIKAKVATEKLELEQTVKINDADKLKIDIHEKITAGLLKLSPAEKKKLDTLVAEYDTTIKANDLKKARLKIDDDARKQAIKSIEDQTKVNTSLEEGNKKLREQIEEIGLTVPAINALRLARLDAVIAQEEEILTMASAHEASQEEILMMQKRIKLLKEQRALTATGQQKEIEADQAKTAEAYRVRVSEGISQSITDSLMRGFENGKPFAENFADTVENLFKTMVLRPAIEGVFGVGGQGGSGGFGQAVSTVQSLYNGGSALLQPGGVGDLIGDKLYEFGDKLSNTTSGPLANFGSDLAANSSKLGKYAEQAGNALSYLEAASNFKDGSYGQSIGQGLGTYFGGPLGGQIGKSIGGWVDKLFGKGEYVSSTGDSARYYNKDGSLQSNTASNGKDWWKNTPEANAFVDSMQAQYLGSAKALGIGSVATQFSYGSNNSDGGKFSLGGGATGTAFGAWQGETKTSPEAVKLAASRAVFAALQGSDLPKYLKGIFDGLDANTMTSEQINNTLQGAAAFKSLHDSLASMAGVLGDVSDLSYTAMKDLGDLSGGLDKFAANVASAAKNYTTADAQRQATLNSVNTALAGVGYTGAMPTDRAQYAALLNQAGSAESLATESGRKFFATLLDLNEAFASVTPSLDDMAKAVAGVHTSVQKSIFDMQYGMGTNQDKYNMLDVKGAKLDAQMRSATGVMDIAQYAQDQIALINQAWSLLDSDQQQASFSDFEARLTAIDEYVTSHGADATGVQKAKDEATAKTIADAVETAVAKAMQSSSQLISDAAEVINKAADKPAIAEVRLSVTKSAGVEVSVG